jgi:phosphoglycolate phosphatase
LLLLVTGTTDAVNKAAVGQTLDATPHFRGALKGMHHVIIFDFDGVLADTLDDMLHYARQVCEQLGVACQPTRKDLDALDHMSFDEFGRQLGVPERKISEFTRRNLQLFSSPQRPPRIFDGLRQVVAQLAQTHKLGIVTGNISEAVWNFLRVYGLAQHVQIVLDADAEGTRAEKIARAAASLGQAGSRVYVIGDAVSDVRAARQAGALSVAVTWGHQSRAKLEGAAPDYVVGSPEELLQLFAGLQAGGGVETADS